METFMRYLLVAILALLAGVAISQSTSRIGKVDDFSITSYPLYGEVAVQHDTNPLAHPGMLRANSAGAVTAACWGQPASQAITLTLAAGEFFPCMVMFLKDTGTDAITIHVFY